VTPSRELKDLAVAALLASGFFLAGVLVPVAGPFLGFFSSAPLIWLGHRAGGRLALLAGVLALAALLPVVPPPAAAFFAAEHLLPGCYLGARLTAGRGLAASSVRATALAAGGLLAIALGAFAVSGADPRAFLDRQIEESIGQAQGNLAGPGAALPPEFEPLLRFLRRTFPALFLFGVFSEAALNGLIVLRLAARALPGSVRLPAVTQFALPERLVWVLIPSLAALWVPQRLVSLVALNLTVLLGFFYLLQGLSIVLHFLARARISRPVFTLLVMVMILQPYLLAIPLALGLLDFRFEFRKRGAGPQPPTAAAGGAGYQGRKRRSSRSLSALKRLALPLTSGWLFSTAVAATMASPARMPWEMPYSSTYTNARCPMFSLSGRTVNAWSARKPFTIRSCRLSCAPWSSSISD